jgi:hypothetical protein
VATTQGSSLQELLFGKPKDPLDPKVFHQISLVAFLAWVGLGADGLSSSAYGPEEAYLALGQHFYLALPLAILTAVTVFVISASYSQIIELFPTGGGGYLVATKLLGPKAGLVSGSALVVDYMLTITISIASSVDALFSFLPASYQPFKIFTEVLLIFMLIFLNLRGVKESVMFMLPIFLGFIAMHIVAIALGVVPHLGDMSALVANSYQEVAGDVQGLGLLTTLAILFHAYSLGGGTYTGIEAVSNGLQILRQPRVETGKRTMIYMATSLAFTASGILLCYLLNQVRHEPGRTLNASLFSGIFGMFFGAESAATNSLVIIILITEAALLIVAAQAGFLDGRGALEYGADPGATVSHLPSIGHAQRCLVHGLGVAGLFALQPRRGEAAGCHVQHQCVPYLHALATRHVPPLVGRKKNATALAAQNGGERLRPAAHRNHPVRHCNHQVRRRRLGHPGGHVGLRALAK